MACRELGGGGGGRWGGGNFNLFVIVVFGHLETDFLQTLHGD